ncbi:MAG: 3-deoxy-8-phosphooctulonate synthase [Bacteroidota bacterium]|nr:3-deoxy-8-phosphooctulonate synthase [Bacteroidota bacterium]
MEYRRRVIDQLNNIKNTDNNNFFLIAGPCVIENEEITLGIAEKVKNICERLKIPFIFKASYKKANRSKLDSFTGIGDDEALNILSQVGRLLGVPTITDIHTEQEAVIAAKCVDILQIPAFLCRQTDLLLAAGRTHKIVNVKKGQFLSASSMKFTVEKIKSTGNDKIILTERGTMFGYNDLLVDFRSIPEMQKNNLPVVLDITHSLQQPNTTSGVTGGKPEFIEVIAKAGIAAGADGIFIETHPEPAKALSDGSNMLKLEYLEELLEKLLKIRNSLF